jgi:hypothetical protein
VRSESVFSTELKLGLVYKFHVVTAGFSILKREFNTSVVHVIFPVVEFALDRIFYRVIFFPMPIIISPMFIFTHLSMG